MKRFCRPLPVACCLLLIAASVHAECTEDTCRPQAVPHAAVARVVNETAGSRCYGSGTLVHKDAGQGIVLTCGHLFREAAGRIVVRFPDGGQFEAKILGVDQAWDLAALAILPPPVDPIGIASQHPVPGDALESCGYGSDGRWWCNQGRALGYARPRGASTHETLQVSGCARDGDSGGPMFNRQGKLVAVIWGTDGRTVSGTYCGRIRRFLGGILPKGEGGRRKGESPEATVQDAQVSALNSRLDGLVGRLEVLDMWVAGAADQQRAVNQRIETAIGLVGGFRDRIEKAEATMGDFGFAISDLKSEILNPKSQIGRGPGLLDAALPGVLAALGWTGPPAIAAMVGLRIVAGLIRRRRKRKGESPESRVQGPELSTLDSRPSTLDPTVIHEQTPPPPQLVRRHREFVPYQKPNGRLQALEMAFDEYVRRHPGARSTVEAIEAYADQYESGQRAGI